MENQKIYAVLEDIGGGAGAFIIKDNKLFHSVKEAKDYVVKSILNSKEKKEEFLDRMEMEEDYEGDYDNYNGEFHPSNKQLESFIRNDIGDGKYKELDFDNDMQKDFYIEQVNF